VPARAWGFKSPTPTPSLTRADGVLRAKATSPLGSLVISLSSRFVALRISAGSVGLTMPVVALVTPPGQLAQRGDPWSPGRRMFGGTRRARMTVRKGIRYR
jgi:hypothetical protein